MRMPCFTCSRVSCIRKSKEEGVEGWCLFVVTITKHMGFSMFKKIDQYPSSRKSSQTVSRTFHDNTAPAADNDDDLFVFIG